MWNGDYKFLLKNLIMKDFRIRYRNMSLGVFWSLVNPLVMMGVFMVVFTQFIHIPIENYPLFLLCGIVPFNFFTASWNVGTMSIMDNAGLIKRIPAPREVFPIASVLSVFLHTTIQIVILFCFAVAVGKLPNIHWVWLPVIWALLMLCTIGMALLFSGMHVFIRDTRYVVESATVLLFWFVPIFYKVSQVPEQYRGIYLLNPLASAIVAIRSVILEATPPSIEVLLKLSTVSIALFIAGWFSFRTMKPRFYNYL
jgi:ABC-type polysaccharide/polyol phosphate export permease